MAMKRISLVLALSLLVACGGKDTGDLIVGTWNLDSVTRQSIGHPDQSLNGITTETYGGDNRLSMTFGDGGSGYRVASTTYHDSLYIYVPDTTYVDDTFYVTEEIRYVRDTTFVHSDTSSFIYMAAGNLLNIQEGNQTVNYRIDKLDKHKLILTDTNAFTDIYTNSYGRSIQFTQEMKDTYIFNRR